MTMKIVTYKDYVAGWLDTTMHEFLQALPPNGASTKYALLTCLDSNRDMNFLRKNSPELCALARGLEPVGNGLLVRTEAILDADAHGPIFFGSDEVWFFPSKAIGPKPDTLTIVGPARLSQVRLKKLGKWLADNSCSMALGGGEGLNFVVPAQGLVKFLLGYSIEQPESSLAGSQAVSS